ncbi:MAG: hypothetical protein A2042_01695 [Candidatus Schekmanbacteria bacterium GWA2_38_11]|uniref:Uncharacterized protein n=1 Tax=Candidatus Schekmanbacteria bacterium GWA2_38_11 TaxID=1817876 RepID=A0A1F7RMC1_9BACT|nr:MAG: hypothetical protein A2042_01695 [Candidatus Schekmanbacteria bacterium GWA2_38_11]
MRGKIFGARVINKIEVLCCNNKELAIVTGTKEVNKISEFSEKLKKTSADIGISLIVNGNSVEPLLPQNIFKSIIFKDKGNGGIFKKIKKSFSLVNYLRKNRFDVVSIYYGNTLKDTNISGELGGFLSNSKSVIGIDGNGQLYLLSNKFFIYKLFSFLVKPIIWSALLVILLFYVVIFWSIIFFLMLVSDKILYPKRAI